MADSLSSDPRAISYQESKDVAGIKVQGGDLHSLANALEDALLIYPECGIYQRGGYLVEISTIPEKINRQIRRTEDAHVIVPVTSTRLRELGCKYSAWIKYDARTRQDKHIDCPRDIADTLASRNTWRLPVLVAVLGAPTLREDGTIVKNPGYDNATGVYLHCEEWPTMPDTPSLEDAITARKLLEDLVCEFPFTDDAARATWIAALLTALIRWSLPTAPFFGFDAPVMGAGKSLLASLIGLLVNGHEPSAMAQPKDENEARKGILAALLSGDPILLIDNIEYSITGQVLCTIATSKKYRDRFLGQSKMVTVSTAVTFIYTGNNLTARGDVSTRMVMSRLDPGVEHPEERTFQRDDIKSYVIEHRHELVNAALTIIRAYQVAGMPACGLKPFGRFEDWSARVRAPLVWCGTADPCETRNRVESIDPEREQLGELLEAWWCKYADKEVLVRQMIDDCSSGPGGDESNLGDVIHSIAADGSRLSHVRLGRKIGRWEGRVCGGLRIKRATLKQRAQAWKIEQVSIVSLVSLPQCNTENCQTIKSNTREETHTDSLYSPMIKSEIAAACSGLTIRPEELLTKLSAQDITDIESGAMTPDQLRIWAEEFDRERR